MSTPALQPTTNVYAPKTEYRLSRDIFSFSLLGGTKTSSIDSSYPFITQNIGNDYYTGYDTGSRKFGNFAYVKSGHWYVTHDKAEDPSLTGDTGLINVDLGVAVQSTLVVIGKGHWANTPDRTKVSSLWRGSIEVGRYEYPVWDETKLSIKRVTISRVYSGGAYVYSSSITTVCSYLNLLNESGAGIAYNLALSRIGTASGYGSYIVSIARKYPTATTWNAHIHIEFWKLTGAGSGSEVWTKLAPFWSFPIDDTDYKQDLSVDTTQWTEFCYSAPYDGNGLSTSLGMSVTVFNVDKNGKAMYFVEQDGFCSDLKQIIPVYNSSQADYRTGLGSTSFKPTGLVQVGSRRDTLWSGMYLTGTFTRTAEDGISIQMQCYMRGNSLVTNSDTVSSGVASGHFGWTFGARNFYLGLSEGQIVFPHPTDSKWALEFDYEPAWQSDFGESWPTVVDTNSGANNAFDALIPYWYAFSVSGKVYRCNMDASTLHNPPWVAASDILQWSFQEATDTASSLTVVVERSSAAKFQSGGTVGIRYWSTEESTGDSAGVLVGYFQIEEESYDNSSGLLQPLTIQCIDTSSSIVNNWSSPIDMFFDPKFVSPLSEKGDKSLDPIPSLANLIQKTPNRDAAGWDKITGYSHWGINRPSIFFNTATIQSPNVINKHRIKFGTSVDANLGVQSLGSLFSAYKDGTMAGAFLMQTPASGNARPIFAQSTDSRGTSALDTGAHSTRIATNANNRVTIMGSILPTLKNDDGTEKSNWEIEDGGRSLVGMNGSPTIAGATSYKTKAEQTIFGANSDATYGLQRIAGGGTYLYDANISIAQGTQYDFATKTAGENVLVWYKPVQYDATTPAPPASNTNNWTLCTWYRASTKYDSWMRPSQNRYTGVALSTDSWFSANTIWPDSEVGTLDIRYNEALATTDGLTGVGSTPGSITSAVRATRRYLLDNKASTTLYTAVTGGAGGSTTTTIPTSSGNLGLTAPITGTGGIFKMSGKVYTKRFWDCIGSKAVSVEVGVDPTNPTNDYTGDSNMVNWIFQLVPNVLFRAQAAASSDLVNELGIPYRAADGPSKRGYMIAGTEVFHWMQSKPERGIARVDETTTNGDYLIHIPVDHFSVGKNGASASVVPASKKIIAGSWRNGKDGWRGGYRTPVRAKGTHAHYDGSFMGSSTYGVYGRSFNDFNTGIAYPTSGAKVGKYFRPEYSNSLGGGNYEWTPHGAWPNLGGSPANGDTFYLGYFWNSWPGINPSDTTVTFGVPASPEGLANFFGDPTYPEMFKVGNYIQFCDAGNTTSETSIDYTKEILRIAAVSAFSQIYEGWRITVTFDRAQLGTTAASHSANLMWWGIPSNGVAGIGGMGKNSHIEIFTPYGMSGESSEYHLKNWGEVSPAPDGYTEITVWEDIATGFSEFDVGIISGRGQLGTTKTPHELGEYISAYPVKNLEDALYPADNDSATLDGIKDYAIKDAVRLYRNTTFSGTYKSVRDNLFSTTSLPGARSVFKEKYQELTTSYVDTLQNLYTTGNWSIALQAKKSVDANANFKSAIIKFRSSSSYYLTIDSWTGGANRGWAGDANTRAIRLRLSWGSESSNVLEEVIVPLLGMPVGTNLTLPIVVSLSGDVLSVDALEENLWSFDLSQYTDGTTSIYRTSASGAVEIKTLDTQAACYWFSSELGDEVESTVVDRGAPASSAFSFLLNGRWVKTIIDRNGFLQHGRFFTRRSPFDFYNTGASTLRSRYTLTTQEQQNPHIAAGHVESSGAEFAEMVDDSWIRSNGYVFKESQNRLLLTASDSRLESRLRIRAEKEANEHILIVGHPAPAVQPEDAVSWDSNAAQDYVVDSHTIEVALASASSKLSCRKYYDIQ